MAGEDQERFEDYLELERYIEELQAGHAAYPPKDMTTEQASIYRMAALFRSAVPNAAEPHPDFAEQLKARLLAGELEPAIERVQQGAEIVPPLVTSTAATSTPERAEPVKGTKKRVSFVSRRTLLAGGAIAAAASFAIGVGLDRTIGEQSENTGIRVGTASSTPTSSNIAAIQNTMIGLEGPTNWLFVTTLAELGSNATRFVSDAIIGYVVRDETAANTKTTATAPAIIAMSAACTHMGCIVRWEQADHQFHCPCHDALFTSQGEGVVHDRYTTPLPSLPRLNTKVVDGNIYVEVPAQNS